MVKAESFVCTINTTSSHVAAKFSTETCKKTLVITKYSDDVITHSWLTLVQGLVAQLSLLCGWLLFGQEQRGVGCCNILTGGGGEVSKGTDSEPL